MSRSHCRSHKSCYVAVIIEQHPRPHQPSRQHRPGGARCAQAAPNHRRARAVRVTGLRPPAEPLSGRRRRRDHHRLRAVDPAAQPEGGVRSLGLNDHVLHNDRTRISGHGNGTESCRHCCDGMASPTGKLLGGAAPGPGLAWSASGLTPSNDRIRILGPQLRLAFRVKVLRLMRPERHRRHV